MQDANLFQGKFVKSLKHTLLDSTSLQDIKLGGFKANSIKIIFISYYKGSKYKDVCVSQIKLIEKK